VVVKSILGLLLPSWPSSGGGKSPSWFGLFGPRVLFVEEAEDWFADEDDPFVDELDCAELVLPLWP